MQAREWLKLNADGSVDLDLSDEPKADWRHLRLAKVRHVRTYGMMLEDADDATSKFEASLRDEVGYTDEVVRKMQALMGMTAEELPAEELLNLPDAQAITRQYMSGMQRWILSPDNPYPALWHKILSDASLVDNPIDADMDPGDLPTWTLSQDGLALITQHWQSVPFIGRMEQTAQAPSQNRAARRASQKKTA